MSNDILWGKTGHRVVGEVASKYISKNTRTSLDKILEGQSLAYISTYADEIKSDKNIPSIMFGTMQILI